MKFEFNSSVMPPTGDVTKNRRLINIMLVEIIPRASFEEHATLRAKVDGERSLSVGSAIQHHTTRTLGRVPGKATKMKNIPTTWIVLF